MTTIEKNASTGSSLAALRGVGASAAGGQSFDDVLAGLQAASAETAAASAENAGQGDAELANDYRNNLKQLRERLEKILQTLGIDTTGQPLKLQVNPGGEISVSGENAGRADLQNAINQDPQLVALFSLAAQQGEQLNDAEKPTLQLPGVHQWRERFALEIDGITQTPILE